MTGIALEREARRKGAARVEVFIFKGQSKEMANVAEDEENFAMKLSCPSKLLRT